MTEQAIDLDALAADLTAAGLECHIEDYSVFADTPKKRNRIQRRWRVTGFGHMFQAQFNWGEWGPNGTVLVDDWVYLDIIRSHLDPMYAKQAQIPCAPTAFTSEFDVMAHLERPNDEIMADMILINRGRVHRLFDLALSYLEYDQSVIKRAVKAIQYGDTEDDVFTMPAHVCSSINPKPVDLHARLIEIFNANTTPSGAGNATCFDFDGVAAADQILQLLGYPAIERPRREVPPAEEGEMPW